MSAGLKKGTGPVHIGTNAIEGILLGIILIAGFITSQVIQHHRKSGR